ncbi:unnamed protein product [Caenorhabditis auriculariae]|uniref:Cyclin N-terminal domain-containing protein n=1 Tax=Caenorhabditis auriculariae TaxID=2777116 RepID=A0A8S1GS10_9PELO|nr:unnamed protein product [Caenorhabditis auriculariae]
MRGIAQQRQPLQNAAEPNKQKEEKKGGLRMVRQIGRTNLMDPNKVGLIGAPKTGPVTLAAIGRGKSKPQQSSFEVFVDSSPARRESTSNNMIHVLEKFMEEKEKAKIEEPKDKENAQPNKAFGLRVRHNTDDIPYIDESVPSSVHGFSLDENAETAAQTGATMIRAELAKIKMTAEMEAVGSSVNVVPSPEAEFKDADRNSEYAKALAMRDQANEAIFNSDEYYQDIYRYMAKRQQAVRSSSRYMRRQREVTVEMRAILVDWFCDVAVEYALSQETIHLAVSIVDRVLSLFMVEKSRLQLVGTTALMIASKYEEIFPPELKDFAHITDDSFTTSQILMMEQYLLNQLGFVVGAPTVSWFGTMFAKRQGADRRTRLATQYLMDLTLLDYSFLKYKPSFIAAACLCYANILTGLEPWSAKMVQDTGLSIRAFAAVLPELHVAFTSAPSSEHGSVHHRFSSPEYESVASIPPPATLPAEVAQMNFGVVRPSVV